MRRRWDRGQTTTEFLMISGIMTAVTIFLLKLVFSGPMVDCPSTSTIQCTLQTIADAIINGPDEESSAKPAQQCGPNPGPCFR